MNILSIDPGNIETGYAVINANSKEPLCFGKVNNRLLEYKIRDDLFLDPKGYPLNIDLVVIELVRSYGMAVGQSVFDTCIQIGRFAVLCEQKKYAVDYIPRKEYVTEFCGSSRAKDGNVIQYLIDRFAPDTPNRGKGSKKEPGWFYGFKADVWQAYALGVYMADKEQNVL